MNKILIIITIFSLLISCADHGDNQKKTHGEPKKLTVDLDKAIQYNFYELFDTTNITYIQLESSPNSLIGEIKRFYFINNKFICISNNKLVVFNQYGKFLFSIGKRGKGPKEYLSLDDVYIDDNNIYILDRRSKKIIKYNTEGEFLITLNTGLNAETFTKINDDIFCLYIGSNKNDISSYRVNFYSERQKKIISEAIPITENEYKWMYFFDLNNFTVKDKNLLFKYSFNDTIYNLNTYGLSPYFLIDWGQYKLPDNILKGSYSDILDFNNKAAGKYIYSTIGLFSSSNHLSFGFKFKDAMYQALYDWRDNSMKIINGIMNPYGIVGNSLIEFSLLPQASDEEFFYTLVEPYYINEISKGVDNLPAHFLKIDAEKNPLIAKFKYRSNE